MTKDEVLKLALEALEMFCEHGAILRPIETRDAIKEALMSVPDGAQPEQEPVAQVVEAYATKAPTIQAIANREHQLRVGDFLYTTPPQRKPLTDEKFRSILASLSRQQGWDGDGWDLAFKLCVI